MRNGQRIACLHCLVAALAASTALATVAKAQPRQKASDRLAPELRDPTARADRTGMMARLPGNEEVTLGLGRFSVVDPPRLRTHTETERDPTGIRRRERGIGGVGLRARF
jgi:hypothetical protein